MLYQIHENEILIFFFAHFDFTLNVVLSMDREHELSNDDIFNFMEQDLRLPSSPIYPPILPFSDDGNLALDLTDDLGLDTDAECNRENVDTLNISKNMAKCKSDRRESLQRSLEDALTISALNPLQKEVSHVLSRDKRRWQPPNFKLDTTTDSHSFLSPKLFHSKKLLDRNRERSDQFVRSLPRKQGPLDIGRAKGFKAPKFDDFDLEDQSDTLFLDEYRSWYPPSTLHAPDHPVPREQVPSIL